MRQHSESFVKWMSTGRKLPKRIQQTSKKSTAIERAWIKYLKCGRFRPMITCIVVGGIEMEKKYL